MIQYFIRKWTVYFSTKEERKVHKMKRLFLALFAITVTLIFAGCSDGKGGSSSEENSSSETSHSEVTSESTSQEPESETTAKTTKKTTKSTPIPTQATLKTTPRSSSTTSVTTTTTTTTTEQVQTEPTTTKFSMTEGVYSVLINGKRVSLGMDIRGRINEFGALQATVSQVGDISIYSYEDCKITAQSGYVKQISITGESVTTDTGITIGSSKEEVLSKYGNAAYSASIVYASSGASAVQFNIENDLVTMITLSVS